MESHIERLFFHKWHRNEAELRRFVASAGHFEQVPALCRAFADALVHFAQGAPPALYLRGGDGIFRLEGGGLSGASPDYVGDDPAFALLRAERGPVETRKTHGALPDALALPMLDQGGLAGFVLLGRKPDGTDYRPDERELLSWATHQVGLDLQALHARELEVTGRRSHQQDSGADGGTRPAQHPVAEFASRYSGA